MVKRVSSEDDGYIHLVSPASGPVQSDEFRLYEAIRAGKAPHAIDVDISPDCGPADKEADFVTFGSLEIVASPTVPQRLVEVLEASCHRIELNSPKKTYVAYLTKYFYDASDLERSIYERFDFEPHNISYLKREVLRAAAIGDAPVFKISGERAFQIPVYVSDAFYNLYKELGATGLRFWDVELS